MSRSLDHLVAETRELHIEADSELDLLMVDGTAPHYRRYLMRMFGFVRPLELAVIRTPHLAEQIDLRRFRKQDMIRRDLQTLGVKPSEIDTLPQCTSVPWFDAPLQALGWAFVVERTTLGFPSIFHFLAKMIPGEVAFASSYLKCYASFPDMWRTFGSALDACIETPDQLEHVVDATRAAYRHYRRFRHALDGKSVTVDPPHEPIRARATTEPT